MSRWKLNSQGGRKQSIQKNLDENEQPGNDAQERGHRKDDQLSCINSYLPDSRGSLHPERRVVENNVKGSYANGNRTAR